MTVYMATHVTVRAYEALEAQIARLQEQVEAQLAETQRAWNERDGEKRGRLAAEAERDRLREALTRIADGGRGSISAAEKNHIAFAALQKEPQP